MMSTRRRMPRSVHAGAPIVVLLGLMLMAATVSAAPDGVDAAAARARLEEAKDLGANRQLPTWYREAQDAVELAEQLAEEAGPSGSRRADTAAREAWRLANRLALQAAYVDDLRERKNEWQAVVDSYEHALERLAAAAGVAVPEDLAGPEASRELERILAARTTRARLAADSLAVAHRLLSERCEGELAAKDSALTSVEVELSSLRRRLWETELRAGMAEADRSAAESVLDRQREREDAIHAIGQDFGQGEGEVLLTPDGDVILHVYGFSFAVGSAGLPGGGDALIDKLAAAVNRFPGARLRIEGHTDNTGSRQANQRLSRRRAESVAAALLEKTGLAEDLVEIVGFGPDRPLATNETAEGRALNRRIDVVILNSGG